MWIIGDGVRHGKDPKVTEVTKHRNSESAQHNDLHLLWIKGEDLPLPIWYHLGREETEVGRLARLKSDKAEHEKMAQRKADDMHLNLQQPIAPEEIEKTNLYRLFETKTDFLPWPALKHGGIGFVQRWGEFARTEDFRTRLSNLTLWWYGHAMVRVSFE